MLLANMWVDQAHAAENFECTFTGRFVCWTLPDCCTARGPSSSTFCMCAWSLSVVRTLRQCGLSQASSPLHTTASHTITCTGSDLTDVCCPT